MPEEMKEEEEAAVTCSYRESVPAVEPRKGNCLLRGSTERPLLKRAPRSKKERKYNINIRTKKKIGFERRRERRKYRRNEEKTV